jgi:hypothetical protein
MDDLQYLIYPIVHRLPFIVHPVIQSRLTKIRQITDGKARILLYALGVNNTYAIVKPRAERLPLFGSLFSQMAAHRHGKYHDCQESSLLYHICYV